MHLIKFIYEGEIILAKLINSPMINLYNEVELLQNLFPYYAGERCLLHKERFKIYDINYEKPKYLNNE